MNSLNALLKNNTRHFLAHIKSYASQPAQYETLAVSVPKKNVYHVELNRPQKLNTLNQCMWSDLKKCFNTLHNDSDCRVVVISGQGKLFTAGIDLQSLVEYFSAANEIEDIGRRGRFLYKFIKDTQECITAVEECMKPVLAVVHGACLGAGVDLITAADIRYCTEDAWFQVKEVDVGLAADVGTLQRLPKVIGSASVVRELCYSARKVDAKEALDIGLVGKMLSDKQSAIDHALSMAELIASKSPVAVQATKQNILYSQDKTPREGLEHIALLNMLNHQSEDLSKSAIAAASRSGTPEFENY
ncbi:hypothetical protein ACJJTC_000232 [Scirpophaga incertulas]